MLPASYAAESLRLLTVRDRGEKGREQKFYNKFNVSPVLVSFLDRVWRH